MPRCRPSILRPVAVSAALIAGLAAPSPSTADDGDAPEKVFVGYLFGRAEGIDFSLYTHLFHAFVTADADGRVRPGRGVPDAALAEKAHEAGVKMVISLGGWGWDDEFAAIVADPEAEDRYVEAVLAMVDEADYDGLDLDWEYPDGDAEVPGFERLARRLRAGLDELGAKKGRPMVLTMAASSNPGTLRWLDREFLVETMDWINVMTYDMAGDWTDYAGHNAPLFASSKQPSGAPLSSSGSMRFLLDERGVPADRLALGIPLYGRGFAVAEPYAPTKDAPDIEIPRGNSSNLDRLLDDEGWTRIWDDETKVPWLLAPDRNVVIGYDDAESVGLKTEWARDNGLRGVFFWQVAADRMPDGSHPLQEAAREALDAGAPGAG